MKPPLRHLPIWTCCFALVALLCVCMTIAIAMGSVRVPPLTVWKILWSELLPHASGEPTDWTLQQRQIVWMLRLPRVLMAALVGAGLATVGVVMQAMVRNPLADPYMLGVSSGASVGAVSVLAWGSLSLAGIYAISVGAFAGALIAAIVVYWLARVGGQIHSVRLILSGVAVGYFLLGLTSLITLTSGQRDLANALLTWTLGSLAGAQWDRLPLPAAVLFAGVVWLALQARSLNALLTGDETAATLGVNTHRLRRSLFVVVSMVTGTMVAVSGAIGFVGLVVPHITRMLVGSEHRRVLPVAALLGAIFLVIVDLLARVLFAPMEVPAGVITSLVGGPFFVWMLIRNSRRQGVFA